MALSPLIDTGALQSRFGAPDLRIIDATWNLDGTDPRPGHAAARIPGAVFLDLDAVSDTASSLPHMLPRPDAFAEAAGALGVGRDDHIVVYDAAGLFSAARIWWAFRIMGADRVQVLDGGLPKWRAEGRPLESGPPVPPVPARFETRFAPDMVADLAEVRAGLADQASQIVDARPAARFRGEAPEPRPGLRCGHMPGALSLPYSELLGPDGTLKRGAALETVFRDAGVDLNRPVTTTCGSGVTAAIVSLALAVLDRDSRLYDGSWAEWGGRDDTAIIP